MKAVSLCGLIMAVTATFAHADDMADMISRVIDANTAYRSSKPTRSLHSDRRATGKGDGGVRYDGSWRSCHSRLGYRAWIRGSPPRT